jgi:hypothetical protein
MLFLGIETKYFLIGLKSEYREAIFKNRENKPENG